MNEISDLAQTEAEPLPILYQDEVLVAVNKPSGLLVHRSIIDRHETHFSLQPHTGRKHQLRRHMKHLFRPIVGDTTHGDGKHNRMFRDHYANHRLLLHHQHMEFSHPVSSISLEIEAPLEHSFTALLVQIELPPHQDPESL